MWAEGEDLWDDIVGIRRGPNEVGWVDATTRAATEIIRNMRSLDSNNLERQRLYWEIVQREKQLAATENAARKMMREARSRAGRQTRSETENPKDEYVSEPQNITMRTGGESAVNVEPSPKSHQDRESSSA